MPVSTQVGRFCGNDDQVANAWLDRGFTPGALVDLYGLIRLDGVNDLVVEACKLG